MAKIVLRKHAFKRLHELPPEIIKEVDDRLLSGATCTVIEGWLKEKGYFNDLQPGSVRKSLERYRATDLRHRVIARITEQQVGSTRVAAVNKKLNALEEMDELVRIQRTRFDKAMMMESPGKLLMKMASDEARLLKDMLVELGHLQLETGLLARAPRKVTGSLTTSDGEVHTFSWKEEQEQLYKLLQLKLGNDEGEHVVIDNA